MLSFNKCADDIQDERARGLASLVLGDYPDEELFFCISGGFLFYRLILEFSADYMFGFPIRLDSEASLEGALAEITEYCIHEDIEEVLINVPPEHLAEAVKGAVLAELHTQNYPEGYFLVDIKNELATLLDKSELGFCYDGINFELPSVKYAGAYKRLTSLKEHNKYYGYEISDDMPDAGGEDMVSVCLRELDNNRSLTFFITDNKGDFIGEAALYSFDGRGRAECSFRVVPEKCGMGYGKKIIDGIVYFAKNIDMKELVARAMAENIPAISVLNSSRMKKYLEADGVAYYHFKPEFEFVY